MTSIDNEQMDGLKCQGSNQYLMPGWLSLSRFFPQHPYFIAYPRVYLNSGYLLATSAYLGLLFFIVKKNSVTVATIRSYQSGNCSNITSFSPMRQIRLDVCQLSLSRWFYTGVVQQQLVPYYALAYCSNGDCPSRIRYQILLIYSRPLYTSLIELRIKQFIPFHPIFIIPVVFTPSIPTLTYNCSLVIDVLCLTYMQSFTPVLYCNF